MAFLLKPHSECQEACGNKVNKALLMSSQSPRSRCGEAWRTRDGQCIVNALPKPLFGNATSFV